MSFGFSVGDFIAVGSLISQIVGSLREAGGSKSEYQELLSELEGLQRALLYLDKLQSRNTTSTSIDSIKYAALSCRRPLEHFLDKIKKYDCALGVWSKAGSIKSTVNKLKWAYTQKDEIRKLQTYLNVHVGTINILLAEHGLDMMDISSESSKRDHLQVRDRLEDTRKVLDQINSSAQAQAQAVAVANFMLGQLFKMVSGEVLATLKSLAGMVSKVCVSTQQIYTIVLEIKSAVGPGDIRWTYFQAPLIVEDALGLKFPVPSEYDPVLLDAIIKHRFLEGPGSLEVTLGNYELFQARDSSQVISPQSRLLPGTSIIMAILFERTELSDQECPMPRCRSNRTTAGPGGGRICCECSVFFDKSNKKLKSLQDLFDVVSQQNNEVRHGKRKPEFDHDAPKRRRTSSGKDIMHPFRNVRCTELTDAYNPREQLNDLEENPIDSVKISAKQSESHTGDTDLASKALHISSHALEYLDLIKAEYPNQPEKYNLFLDVMKAFKEDAVDTQRVIEHVTYLFQGREALLQGFDRFLPEGYSMPPGFRCNPNFTWSLERSPRNVNTAALDYLSLVEAEYQNQPEIYNLFLDAIKAFKKHALDTQGVIEHVAYLFSGKETLLQGFNEFLPPGHLIPPEYRSNPNFTWNLESPFPSPSRHTIDSLGGRKELEDGVEQFGGGGCGGGETVSNGS